MGAPEAGGGRHGPPDVELIERFFFAYRDFVADVDRILAEYGLGRAHHRVLHFVARRPGLAVADLLDILRITKQSLNRVVRELARQGLLEQRTGTADRRQRPLFPTPDGRALALRLLSVQSRRLARALPARACDREAVGAFLLGMADAAVAAPRPAAPAAGAVSPDAEPL